MDEVQLERMIQKYKDSGELDSEDPALVMLKQWPASKQYKDNHDKLRGLEQKVCIFTGLAGPQYSGRCKIFLLLFFFTQFVKIMSGTYFVDKSVFGDLVRG